MRLGGWGYCDRMKSRKVSSATGIEVIDTQIPQKYIRMEWLNMHARQLDSLINTVTDPTHDNMATGRVYYVCLIIFATMVEFGRRDTLMAQLEKTITDAVKKNEGLDYGELMRVKSESALKVLPMFTDYVDLAIGVSHTVGIGSTGDMPDADKMDYGEFDLPDTADEEEGSTNA